MRAVNRFPFHKVEFVPSLLTPITGQIIRWNAHQSSIAAKITRPLLYRTNHQVECTPVIHSGKDHTSTAACRATGRVEQHAAGELCGG